MSNEKKQSENSIKMLLLFAGNKKQKLFFSIFLATFGVLFGLIPYFSVAEITAAFYYERQSFLTILFWSAAAILGLAIKMLFTTISSMKSHEAAFSIMKNIRMKLIKKMERVPMGIMIDTPTGAMKTLVIDVVEKLEKPLAHILPEMTSNILVPSFTIILLFILDWRMALASLATIPVGFLIFTGQMIGYKEKSEQYAKANDEMNNAIVEYVNGIEVIKAFNQSASSYGKFTASVRYFRDFTLGWWKKCWLFSSVGNTVISSTLLVTLPVGAFLFMYGSLSFSTFITCVILSLGIAGPILAASQFVESFSLVSQSLKQILEFLEAPELQRPCQRVTFEDSAFEFKNVGFGYGDQEILHQINLSTVPSGMTAIVGPSGSGKSTVAKLMAGFWDVKRGTICFGGKKMEDIPSEQLMEQISYVAQDNFLFDISLKENIRIGRPDATDEEVYAAAKTANCHEFITKLENGYDTDAGEAGRKLSGGERQRITIARAVLKQSNVIILDEATAYADPESEAVVQNAINKLVAGKTLIVIAHRLSTIKNADQIVVMEKGSIIARGTQEELLSTCPLYQRMWREHMTSVEVA